MTNIRIGILGSARIAPEAIIRPASRHRATSVTAVANRSAERARGFARRHGIARAHESFQALLEDPEVDAVYIALPNSQHAWWARKALAARKHVLVEKPAARNAEEARELAAQAAASDKVCMVAFHNRMHPLFSELRELLPRIGPLQRVETAFHLTAEEVAPDDIRYNFDLAGGALMDLGCYELHLVQSLLDDRAEVVDAKARAAADERIDERMDATVRYGEVEVRISSSFREPEPSMRAHFHGSDGEIVVEGFVKPHLGNRIQINAPGCHNAHEATTATTTYDAQLARFVAAIEHGRDFPCTVEDSVRLAETMDAIYRAAGLPLR